MTEKGVHVLFLHPEIRTNEPPQHGPYGILQLLGVTDQWGFKVGLIDNNAFRLPIDAVRQEIKGNPQPKTFRFKDTLEVTINPNGTMVMNSSKFVELYDQGLIDKEFIKILCDEVKRLSHHEIHWDIIGIGGLTTQFKYIVNLAKIAREEFPDALIVGGGGFMSAQPFEMMKWIPEFNIGCIGEAYKTWRDVLEQYQSGQNWSKVKGLVYREGSKVKLSPIRPLIPEEKLDEEIPYPAYEFSPVETYIRNSPMPYSIESSGLVPLNLSEGLRRLDVITSYGCPWSCYFCFHLGSTPSCQSKIYGKKVVGKAFRQHSVKYVVNLIDHLRRHYGVNFISFGDENFSVNRKWFNDFCAELEEQDLATLIKWGIVAHTATVDQEMLTKAHDVGLSYISYGGESGSTRLLKEMGKGQTPEQMTAAIEATHAAGVNPIMSFIVGFPGETIDDVIATCQFFIDNQVHCDPFILQPYPGSALYDKYKDKIIEQHMTDEERTFLNNPNVDTWVKLERSTGVEILLPSKSKLMKELPVLKESIRDIALKRWVLSLDDATKMSANLTDFTDVELAGLKYMLFHWDIDRLKKFKEILGKRKNAQSKS